MAVRTLNEDGTLHFTDFKKLALSGVQYLHACNSKVDPTHDMRVGTVAHSALLGSRPGAKPIVVYGDGIRRGKRWDEFEAANTDKEIVIPSEWSEGNVLAEAVRRSPIAKARLTGARFEVPMHWEEYGIPCSTSGIDLVCVADDIGDFKTCPTTHPETFQKHAFRMLYPQQLAFYRRGARANGIKVRDLFILGVERKAPYEVVELTLTEGMIAFAEKSITLWFEALRRNMLSIPEPETIYDWPGFAEAPIKWDVPAWAAESDDEEDAA